VIVDDETFNVSLLLHLRTQRPR